MRNKYVQLSLYDTYTDVLMKMEDNKSEFIELLEEYIDFDTIIPYRFKDAYYGHYGRKRINSLESFIRALILQRLLGMKHNTQLLTLLIFSKELRDFCGFEKLPDEPQITRFKQQFCDHIEMMFHSLVEITELICKEINEKKSRYLIYDTTGIKPNVKENNPKFFNTKLETAKKIIKSNSKSDKDLSPYKLVYSLFPNEAEKAPMAHQQYINGHFCYSYKAGIVTNGLGIVRHIAFFDDTFRKEHPEIVTPKTDDPEKDKEIADSVSLKPVLTDFFKRHNLFQYSTFLGDAAVHSLLVWENPAVKTVLCVLNGYVINPFQKEIQESVSAKIHVRILLTENVLTLIPTRISGIVPVFREIPNTGTICTNTEYLSKELSIFLKTLSLWMICVLLIFQLSKLICSLPAALNLSV